MAFVPLTAASLTLLGRSGKMYQVGFTKATAVGYVTFNTDSQTFKILPEDVCIVDAYVAASSNATDYLDIYINGLIKPEARLNPGGIHAATTLPRTPRSAWMEKGSQFAMYLHSA